MMHLRDRKKYKFHQNLTGDIIPKRGAVEDDFSFLNPGFSFRVAEPMQHAEKWFVYFFQHDMTF